MILARLVANLNSPRSPNHYVPWFLFFYGVTRAKLSARASLQDFSQSRLYALQNMNNSKAAVIPVSHSLSGVLRGRFLGGFKNCVKGIVSLRNGYYTTY